MTKQYSADAIIERDYQAQLNKVPEKKEEVEKPTPPVNPLAPPVNDYQRSLGSGNNDFLLPQSNPTNVVADTEEWDYRTATTDRQGNIPITQRLGNWQLKPQGFTPNGDVYFGEGIAGWWKKLAYDTLEIARGDEEKQQQSKDKITEGWKKLQDANYGFTFANPLDQKAMAEQKEDNAEEAKKIVSGAGAVISGYWGSWSESDSVLSPIVKGVNLAVKTVVDAFTVISETTESALSMNKTIRRYAEEHGSQMPDLGVVDFDPIEIKNGYAVTDELVNTFTRTLTPLLGLYDIVKFWTSEGTLQEKTDALKLGWTEGRMLYTELVKPTVEAEFLLRMKEPGANPDLLVMEMQDPYAEFVGEAFIDPLILLSGGAKAAKFAKLVETSGDLGGVTNKVTDILKVGSEGSTAAQFSSKTDEFVEVLQAYDYTKAVQQVQYKKIFTLGAKGIQTKVSKSMSELNMFIAKKVKEGGGTPDDISDMLVNIYKLSSKNGDEVKEALDFINKQKFVSSKMVFFSQKSLETSHVMRKLIGEGGDIEKKLEKLRTSSWDEQAEILRDLIGDSTKAAIPTVTDMSQAARKVGKLEDVTKTTNKIQDLENQLKGGLSKSDTKKVTNEIKKLKETLPTKTDLQLAKDYVDVKPAVKTLARFDEEVMKFWGPANSFFSGIYFFRYGFANKQILGNNFMVFKEGGISAFWRDGGFKNMTKIEEELALSHPAGLPLGIGRPKSVIDSVDVTDNIVSQTFGKLENLKYSPTQIAASTERLTGIRIFYKYFRDSMNKMMDFGKGIPKQEEWVARGFTPEMALDYKTILHANGYNVEKASKIFRQQYANGTDLFRDLSWIREDVQKGLNAYGGWDELVHFVKDTSVKSEEQIRDFIQNLFDDAGRRARTEVTNPNAVSSERAVVHIEKFGGDAPEIVGFRELQTHIDNAHQASKRAFKKDFENTLSVARKELQKIGNDIATTGKAKPEQSERMKLINKWIDRANEHVSQADEIGNQNDELLKQLKKSLDDWMSENKHLKYGEGEREARWQQWYKAVEDANENYFSFYHEGGTKIIQGDYAKILGVNADEVFKLSRQATVDVLKSKTIVSSKKGGLFHTLPNELTYTTPGQNRHDLNIRDLAKAFGIPVEQKNYLLNIIKKGTKKNTNLTDITLEEAQKIFQEKTLDSTDVVKELKKGNPPVKPGSVVDDPRGLIPAAPIHPGGLAGFNDTHAWAVAKVDLEKSLRYIEDGLVQRLGRKSDDVLTEGMNSALDEFTEQMAIRADEAHLSSTNVGSSYRDFALHPYGETTHFDHALQFALPYHFWATRTYANFAKSLVTNADMIAAYGKWKDFMAQQYADQPEWYKYNTKFPDFLGINEGNPYMVNLESVINPMYGLTGTDFSNPAKRANHFTAFVDDLGKFGPSTFAPLNMAIAAYYANKGQQEVAAAWGTRAFGQTATIKAVSSLFGTPIELDPNVHLFQQGLDPYEEDRISRALAAMALEGTYTQEQLMEAARTHQGQAWEDAYRKANVERAPGQLLSSMLGIGFRPRTKEDMEIEQFYEDYGRVRNLHDAKLISDEEYKNSFNELREAYPFMDIILLSRRSGIGREEAYAYNVISRMPPGMTSEIYEQIGVDPRTAQKFFDSGGKTDGMSETEREDFINAFINAGAILAIPSNSTRREWEGTRSMYGEMEKALQRDYGEEILDDISRFYRLETKKERDTFLEKNPQVTQALDDRQMYVINNPQLMKFYGGIETLERYYESKMYDELEQKFGSDISKIEDAYGDELDPAVRKSILRQHPELRQYWKEKDRIKEENLRNIVNFGSTLKEPEIEWTGNAPENPKQQDLYDFIQTPKVTYQQWEGVIGQPMSELIKEYWYNDEELPPTVFSRLKYMANENGFESGDDMLTEILLSLQQ